MSKEQLDLFSSNLSQEDFAKEEINKLTDLLLKYQYEYYVLAKSSVSDAEYDKLFDQLKELEDKYPQFASKNSPIQRVGSDLTSDLPEVKHTIPVLSLDKVYSLEELLKWTEKIRKSAIHKVTLIFEEKIDGVSIVLYYKNGVLDRAVTRGNGETGNDVTVNVKTIGAVPLKLAEPVTVAVRGEIYLPLEKFTEINQSLENKFANPRNLAAGTIRRIKSSEVSKVPLNIFVYEGFFENLRIATHHEILYKLKQLGFRTNPDVIAFTDSEKDIKELQQYISAESINEIGRYLKEKTAKRKSMGYEIDGLVIKIDNIADREEYGYTGHHPRWAVAYKFESSEAESSVKAIDIQIGRTGRATPVARIEPVEISGSTVSNVTLHNQDYIDFLGLSIGDRVTVSKRGDVIPAIENVVDKAVSGSPVWKIPENCPFCKWKLEQEGAHLFCRNEECSERIKGALLFFVSKGQMDIENLGNETIELLVTEKIVTKIYEFYTTDFNILEQYEGYGPKKIDLIKKGIQKSMEKPFRTILSSLGLQDIGPKVCELLIDAGINSIEKIYEIADKEDNEKLLSINGIGEKTIQSFMKNFNDKKVRDIISRLKEAGLKMEEKKEQAANLPQIFEKESWCVTGSFDNFKPRSLAEDEIKKRGGAVVSQVSGKTTHLLVGESPGSKYDKAVKEGIKIVTEQEFLKLLQQN